MHIIDHLAMLKFLWLRNHCTICGIWSIEGHLICQIADRGPRFAIWHINLPSMLHIIYHMVVTLRLTIIERTISFRSTAILQVDMTYIKPARSCLSPWGAEVTLFGISTTLLYFVWYIKCLWHYGSPFMKKSPQFLQQFGDGHFAGWYAI